MCDLCYFFVYWALLVQIFNLTVHCGGCDKKLRNGLEHKSIGAIIK